MASKIFCDGCDTPVNKDRIMVIVSVNGGSTQYDLCHNCLRRMDPTLWPRPDEPLILRDG